MNSKQWEYVGSEEVGDVPFKGDIIVEVGMFEKCSDMLELIRLIAGEVVADSCADASHLFGGIRLHIYGRRKRHATIRVWGMYGHEAVIRNLFVPPDVLELCEVAGEVCV